jgi:ribonucleoside-diphosphate reductase alpha chain
VSASAPPEAAASRPADVDADGQGVALPCRPPVLRGTTRGVDTPLGRVLVTVNDAAAGDPREVLVHAGPAGSDLAAFAEAVGRLCSLCLSVPSTLTPARRLQLIADELGGIGGARGPAGPNGARSLPDAVARALADHAASHRGPRGR